ncbi:MAG: FAD-dependent oxidoreductase, partial [Acetobacteraceae bacterium]
MRVVVMGGGVVGVTTAYQLQRDGHEVVLIERNAEVAAETSWGNAGMIAPGHSFVWSSPKAPAILLKSLIQADQALRFRPSADPRLWLWSARFLAQCTQGRAAANTLRKHRIAAYSQRILHATLADETIDYGRNNRGILYFYRGAASLERGVAHMKILADDGQEIRVLDRDQVIALEPSLSPAREKIAGGVYCPTDETGDCNRFTGALAAICASRGAEFRTGTPVDAIETEGDGIAGVRCGAERIVADAYVMALGNQSPILARRI